MTVAMQQLKWNEQIRLVTFEAGDPEGPYSSDPWRRALSGAAFVAKQDSTGARARSFLDWLPKSMDTRGWEWDGQLSRTAYFMRFVVSPGMHDNDPWGHTLSRHSLVVETKSMPVRETSFPDFDWFLENASMFVARYSGEWLAIGRCRVIAHDHDVDALWSDIKRSGETRPLIIKADAASWTDDV